MALLNTGVGEAIVIVPTTAASKNLSSDLEKVKGLDWRGGEVDIHLGDRGLESEEAHEGLRHDL